MDIPVYAELRCVSNLTLLRGASQPEELIERAKQLGYSALAIAGECSLASIVRVHVAAKEQELKLLVGAQFEVDWGLVRSSDTTPFTLTVLHEMKVLAAADALMSLSRHRSQQVWDAAALRSTPELLRDAPFDEEVLELPAAPEGEEVVFDFASLGLTLRTHPMKLTRPHLKGRSLMTAEDLDAARSGRLVHYAGIVTLRQQPETANGTVFISLEDETGVVQVICWSRYATGSAKSCCSLGCCWCTASGSARVT